MGHAWLDAEADARIYIDDCRPIFALPVPQAITRCHALPARGTADGVRGTY
jgi:hypothetical protein